MVSFVLVLLLVVGALLVLRLLHRAVSTAGVGQPVFLSELPRTERDWQEHEPIILRDWPEDS